MIREVRQIKQISDIFEINYLYHYIWTEIHGISLPPSPMAKGFKNCETHIFQGRLFWIMGLKRWPDRLYLVGLWPKYVCPRQHVELTQCWVNVGPAS